MSFRNLAEFTDIPLIVEMHKSMWCDEFRNYSCHDLCDGGALYENPDILSCDDKIKNKIRNYNYNVYPLHPLYFKKNGSGVDSYIYVGNDSNGRMMIMFECDKRVTYNKTDYTGKRHTL